MDQIPLAIGTACEKLNGVHSTHIGFGYDDQVAGGRGSQALSSQLRSPDADGQAGTGMAVKRKGLFNDVSRIIYRSWS